MPTSPSRRPPATLLSITGLRQALDYGDPHLPRCSAFYDDVRAFRKKFVTSNGKQGPSLHDWRDRDHQDGLKEMTDAYLNRDRNGPLFWPDDPAAPNYNDLQYTRDQHGIESLVRQLFFRMNQQQFRNVKYKAKAKAKAHPTDPASPQGATPDNPINLEQAPTPDAPTSPSRVIPVKEEVSQASHIYEVPESPHPSPPTTTQSRFEPAPTTPQKHGAPASNSSPNRPAKRPKVLRKTIGAKRDPPATTPRRTSARPKVQRGVTDYATEEEFIAALASPEPQENTLAVPEEEANTSIKVVSANGSTLTSRRSPSAPEQHVAPSVHHSPSLPPDPVTTSSSLPASEPPSDPKKISKMMQFDRDPPTHLPTPSTDAPDIITNNPRKSETVDSFKSPAPGARPRIDFLYRVVLSRRPVYSYRKWAPSRKLEEMTFGEFTAELHLQGDVRALVFTVEGPGLRAVEEISRGDELSFDSLRRQIKKVIRGQLMERAADAPLIFEMDIEPVRGESTGGEDEVEDADFVI